MASFRWLHFTDLHLGSNDHKKYWHGIEQELLDDIEYLSSEVKGKWDAVFFTGDLVNRGGKKEFQELNEKLKRIWDFFKSNGSNPVLLPVPGNHDLERITSGDAGLMGLTKLWDSEEAIRRDIWEGKKNSDYFKTLSKTFKNYSHWWENDCEYNPDKIGNGTVKSGLLPGEYSCSLKKNGISIGVIGINTAFLQLAGGDYKEKLDFHVNQINKSCGTYYIDWMKKHELVFLLSHHPKDWFSTRGKTEFNDLDPAKFFTLHLCGHNHDNVITELRTGGSPDVYRFCQSSSLFGLEKYVTIWKDTVRKEETDRKHGFTAGKIDFQDDKNELFLWPRKGERKVSGGWEFDRDNSLLEKGKDFIGPVVLLKKQSAGTGYYRLPGQGKKQEHWINEVVQKGLESVMRDMGKHRQMFEDKLSLFVPKQGSTIHDSSEIIRELVRIDLIKSVSYLKSALKACAYKLLKTGEKKKEAAILEKEGLKIFGWLLIQVADGKWLEVNKVFFDKNNSTINIGIPVETEAGLDIIFSALKGVNSELDYDQDRGSVGSPRSMTDIMESGCDDDGIVLSYKKEIYKSVHHADKTPYDIIMNEKDLHKADDELNTMLEMKNLSKEFSYLAVGKNNDSHPLNCKDTYLQLLKDLPALNLIFFDINGSDSALVVSEGIISGFAKSFFEIRRYIDEIFEQGD